MTVAEAERLALLVDGEEYFDAFAQAAEAAQHSITILAWDFDSRTPLYRLSPAKVSRFTGIRRRMRARLHRKKPADAPVMKLGDFLNALTRRNHRLQVRILIWDYPMIFGLDREFPPLYGLGWRPRRRVHVNYDNTQPIGASHHQKIVVIDDKIAFCGGLDLTARRWDTCGHAANEPRRVAGTAPYPPFHDAMMMVSGDAARALGDVARDRWLRAIGEPLDKPRSKMRTRLRNRLDRVRRGAKQIVSRRAESPVDPWPPSFKPELTRCPVAIARTMPAQGSEAGVREVEQMYLDMIARAKHNIYIENQYFTAHRIGDALAQRLSEEDGPEIVLILRLLSHGWLEALSMEALRTKMLHKLQQADRHGRFRFFYPHVSGLSPEHCIDIHTKLMTVDDEILRVGSANLANRSMGLDTECDLIVQAQADPKIAATVANFRNRLLAEHLGVKTEAFAQEHAKHGTLRAAIDALRREDSTLREGERTLKQFGELRDTSGGLSGVVELADLEKPVTLKQLLPQFAPTDGEGSKRPAWGRLAAIFGLLLAFAAAWQWTPLADFATAEHITSWANRFSDSWWVAIAVTLFYTPASVIMFPRPLITLFGVLAFGPWYGFVMAIVGNLITGWASYVLGARMKPETLRRLAGPNFSRISKVLRQRGVLAVTAVRLVPLAPFAIPGMVAGAARVKMWHFLAGTFLGLLPGVLATTIFGDAMSAALEDSHNINYWIVIPVLLVIVWSTWRVKRWLLTTKVEEERR